MGATDFYNDYIGKATPEEAFSELVQSSRDYEGKRSYTGSICEKDSFIMKECPPRMDPYDYADSIISDNDKWGPAFCVEYKGSYLMKIKKQPYNSWCKGKKGIRAYLFFGYASY